MACYLIRHRDNFRSLL